MPTPRYSFEIGGIIVNVGQGKIWSGVYDLGTYKEDSTGKIGDINLVTGYWNDAKASQFISNLQSNSRFGIDPTILVNNQRYLYQNGQVKLAIPDPKNPGTYISTEDALIQGGTAAEVAAKAENEKRYQEGIAGYTSLRNRVMTGIQNLGQQQAIDTRRNFMNLASQTQQSAMKRGLSGTTIVPAMNQGIQRQQSDALNNLAQNVSTQRSNFDIQTTGLLEGFRERRTDAYPNLDMPLQLLLRQAAGGAT